MTVRVLIWIARIAGAGAMLLGWLYMVFGLEILPIHIVLGITLAVSMMGLGLALVRWPQARRLGVGAVGYAAFISAFGAEQTALLIGPLHGLIQGAHLVLGLGAVLLVQKMAARYSRLTAAYGAGAPAPPDQTVRTIRFD